MQGTKIEQSAKQSKWVVEWNPETKQINIDTLQTTINRNLGIIDQFAEDSHIPGYLIIAVTDSIEEANRIAGEAETLFQPAVSEHEKNMKILSIPMSVLDELIQLKKEYSDKLPVTDGVVRLADELNDSPDEIHERIYSIVHELPEEQKLELAALTWTGRGEFTDDFPGALQYAADNGELEATYLGSKPFDRYLPRAIAAVRAQGYHLN